MTLRTNARIAGYTFLIYIALGIASMVLFGKATSGEGIAEKLANIAQHEIQVRFTVLLTLLTSFCAIVLGVTLWAITRNQDPDLAMLGMTCRVVEGVNGAVSISRTLALLWLATATGASALDAVSAQTLGAYLLRGSPTVSAIFFAVGSTFFSYLLLRGRMIPVPLAWLGVVASVLLVIGLPLQFFANVVSFASMAGWLIWMPMLVFEVWLALHLIVKGVAVQATS